jgi:sec-independent protein translocase protein TatB
MFDIGFSEMLVIAVVALIVIGPERLPKVARTLGHLFGRMQRYVNDVKADISREMELEELRKLQTTIQDATQSFEQSVKREVSAAESGFQKLAQDIDPATPSPSTPAPAPAEPLLPSQPGAAVSHPEPVPGELTAAEATAQLKLDLSAAPTVHADKPA